MEGHSVDAGGITQLLECYYSTEELADSNSGELDMLAQKS